MASSYMDKQPGETIPVTVDFGDDMPAGEVLQATSEVVVTVDGVVVTDFIVEDSLEVSNPTLTVWVTGGSDFTDYKLKFRGVTQTGIFEHNAVVQCRER